MMMSLITKVKDYGQVITLVAALGALGTGLVNHFSEDGETLRSLRRTTDPIYRDSIVRIVDDEIERKGLATHNDIMRIESSMKEIKDDVRLLIRKDEEK